MTAELAQVDRLFISTDQPDNMARPFQSFTQVDSSLGRKFGGSGLGLAMVKLLAELHGGSVAVVSAEHEGSRFAVWLPIREAASAAGATASAHAQANGESRTSRSGARS